jgi:hypothetical protein
MVFHTTFKKYELLKNVYPLGEKIHSTPPYNPFFRKLYTITISVGATNNKVSQIVIGAE